jgi:hypothetical protein
VGYGLGLPALNYEVLKMTKTEVLNEIKGRHISHFVLAMAITNPEFGDWVKTRSKGNPDEFAKILGEFSATMGQAMLAR